LEFNGKLINTHFIKKYITLKRYKVLKIRRSLPQETELDGITICTKP
jgi:hypothetical protein